MRTRVWSSDQRHEDGNGPMASQRQLRHHLAGTCSILHILSIFAVVNLCTRGADRNCGEDRWFGDKLFQAPLNSENVGETYLVTRGRDFMNDQLIPIKPCLRHRDCLSSLGQLL
ncbi:hypothetical protein FKP32DRAFT_859242 [Trametes sanguinea]|nr:hypothetical protein FKP32DRAFT_859242 [Trametes sanguinea]